MIFRRTPPITLNKPPAEDVEQLRASRESWRALAEQLGRRNEVLEAALAKARLVQMADYSTGRQP